MKILITIFLIVGFSIMFVAHLPLYFSFINVFEISKLKSRLILLGVCVFLSATFLISTILLQQFNSKPFEIYYWFSSLWTGYMVNLLLLIIPLYFITQIAELKNINIHYKELAFTVMTLALIAVIVGLVISKNPRLKYVDINIQNLPDSWNGKTAVQISDVHLNHVHKAEFMKQIAKKINGINPDILFITGDFFDGEGQGLEQLSAPLSTINPPLGKYFVTGNHETYLGLGPVYDAILKTDTIVLHDEAVNVDGVNLIGLSYPSRGNSRNFSLLNDLVDKNKTNILLYHEPRHLKEISETGVNFQLSGHTHRGQLFPFNFITKLMYRGYDYGLNKYNDLLIYTTNGAGTWGPPIRTEGRSEIVVFTFNNK